MNVRRFTSPRDKALVTRDPGPTAPRLVMGHRRRRPHRGQGAPVGDPYSVLAAGYARTRL